MAAARSVPAHRWLIIVCVACANWFADLACLIAAADAVGLSVPVATVAQAYLATQLIRQIPASPGGAGIVEASLIIPLAAAGVAIPAATAAVLVYRLVSCWGLPPFGLICWVATRRTSRERAIVGP